MAKLPASTLLAHLPLPTTLPIATAESHPILSALPEPFPTPVESVDPRGGSHFSSPGSTTLPPHQSDLSSCPLISPSCGEADADCDSDRCRAKRSAPTSELGRDADALVTTAAVGDGSDQLHSLPPVKKVKLEYASSPKTAAVLSPTDEDTRKAKCDFSTEMMKIDTGREESAAGLLKMDISSGSVAAALQLKRENSAEEAKFDIHAESSAAAATDQKAVSSPTKDLLLSATAEEMKAEIAKIDSILQGRLLMDSPTSLLMGSPTSILKDSPTSLHQNGLKKEEVADIRQKVTG